MGWREELFLGTAISFILKSFNVLKKKIYCEIPNSSGWLIPLFKGKLKLEIL
ncbi:MAG: hypothetical protein CM15mP106_3330 [Candidatus Neomarinimicrobiota bacterium]|nr:MAG: hypothetical protein CM15mP106_3330 [Candidatus Neomarinimicrobiota bacterium]